MLSVSAISALKDNYIWALWRDDCPEAVVIDPGEAAPVVQWLESRGLGLGAIVVTHHHWDHTHGIADLRARWPVDVHGPAHESQAIEALANPLQDSDELALECVNASFRVLDIPGHTLGHIALHGEGLVFSGDTLFSAGCGRLFEGTALQMHTSLQRLAQLPEDTKVYCGHEYTEANLHFSLAVEPDNTDSRNQLAEVLQLRQSGQPSLPSSICQELKINPFLRSSKPTVVAAAEAYAGQALEDEVAVFAALRQWKDNFSPPPAAVRP